MKHILIKGDNLIKLDKIKDNTIDFIYIDPPYASLGKKGNKYNDYFSSHSSWQDFIKPRLDKARQKLKETGSIAVSIDNTNLAFLIMTLNEVFDEHNFINTFIWLKQKTNKNGILNTDHEYVVCYAKNIKKVKINKKKLDVENDPRYKYTDERASYFLQPNSQIQSAYNGNDANSKEPIEINTYQLNRSTFANSKDNDTRNKEPFLLKSADSPTIVFGENHGENMKVPIEVNLHKLNPADANGTAALKNGGKNIKKKSEPINTNTFALNPSEVDKRIDFKSGNSQKEPIEINGYYVRGIENDVQQAAIGCLNTESIELNTYQLSNAENSLSTDGQCRTLTKNDPITINTHRNISLDDDGKGGTTNNTHFLLDGEAMGSGNHGLHTEPIKQETILIKPRTSWRWCKEKIDWAMKENLIVFKQNKNKEWKVYFKQYKYLTTKKVNGQYQLVPIERNQPYSTIIEGCTNDRSLAKVFGAKNKFHYAKPIALIEYLLNIFTDESDTVLDFFAGSGTTTHAANNTNRNSFSIQNNENKIFDEVLKVRLDFFKIPYKIGK